MNQLEVHWLNTVSIRPVSGTKLQKSLKKPSDDFMVADSFHLKVPVRARSTHYGALQQIGAVGLYLSSTVLHKLVYGSYAPFKYNIWLNTKSTKTWF